MADPTPPFQSESDIRQVTGDAEDYDKFNSRTHRGPKRDRDAFPDLRDRKSWLD